MECECRDFSFASDYMYGEACVWLAERKRDCTVIDAGFAGNTGLHEIQRHLRKHGIEAHTIGIDIQKWDAEVDEFIHADMRSVKMTGVADIVLCRSVVHFFDDSQEEFKRMIENCADWLKPDGVFFTDIECSTTARDWLRRYKGAIIMRAMSKAEAMEHAAKCYLATASKCLHGKELRNRWVTRHED